MIVLCLFLLVAKLAEAGDGAPTLTYPRPRTFYDKPLVSQSLRTGSAIVYGTELAGPNVNPARTVANCRGIGTLLVDGPRDDPGEITNLSNVIGTAPTILLLRVKDVSDPRLKQNLDAGSTGAVLVDPDSAQSVRELLDRLYFGPLGNRPVGPSRVNDFLDRPDATELSRMEKEVRPVLERL